MTLFAIVLLGLGPRVVVDAPINWVTLPESTMQVELHLFKNGKFEVHEWWTGPETKPMPNYAMKGRYTRQWNEVDLEIQTLYSPLAGIVPLRTKKIPIRSVHLLWLDSLGHEHSLTKTSRKPAKISFGPSARLVPRK